MNVTDPDQSLTFLSWVRESTSRLVTGREQGRARAAVAVTLTEHDADGVGGRSVPRTLPFLLAGPPDIAGLRRGAVVRRYPAPGVTDHESDRCPYVELAVPSLPWRYTPARQPAAGSADLHPWMVLLVGTEGNEAEGAELVLTGDQVRIDTTIQDGAHRLGNPGNAYRYAHVQVDTRGQRTARILCGRRLAGGTRYLAVLVPAFDDTGSRRWTAAEPVTVPVYDHWRFHTADPPGSFEDLAAQLQPPEKPVTVGLAALRLRRLPDAEPLPIRGALTSTNVGVDPALPAAVVADIRDLRTPLRDEENRPIVTLPRYGDAWPTAAPDDDVWGRSLNRDPRHRGVAGLGLEIGIRYQEELVTDALAHLGALAETRQRLRHAVLGTEISRALWRRRLPEDPQEQLWVFGPALRRLTTTAGTVDELATGPGRTLPAGVFSAAARRMLRDGPARTTLLRSRVAPRPILESVNQPAARPPRTVDGVPLAHINEAAFDDARAVTVQAGGINRITLFNAAFALIDEVDARLRNVAGSLVSKLQFAVFTGRAPWGSTLMALADGVPGILSGYADPEAQFARVSATLTDLRDNFDQRADDEDLVGFVRRLTVAPIALPAANIVRLDQLAAGVAAAFDPNGVRAPVMDRVLDTITSADGSTPVLGTPPGTPPEICVGLDRPMWADLEHEFGQWLLPAAPEIADNRVVALKTNPAFIDAFLCGVNTQLLAELRWRNIAVATGCTPLRRFWDRFDTAAGERVDDIASIATWTADSTLGDPTHQSTGGTGGDLVIAIRGQLFLRYPTTTVFLTSAKIGGVADFNRDPPAAAPRIFPGFQGRLGDDLVFFGFPGFPAADVASHWVVFEEPPAGYRFANDNDTANQESAGHRWAAAALARPVRVLISGKALVTVNGGT